MGGWVPLGLRIRYPRTRDGDSPEIIPPFGVILLIPFSAVWLTASFVFWLLSPDLVTHPLGLAIFGCVIPMAIAYGVVTNRRWTRVATVIGLGVCAISMSVELQSFETASFVISPSASVIAALWWIVAGYLYLSKKARKYYLQISGKPLPSGLVNVDLAPPEWMGKVCNGLSFCAEWLLVVVALLVFAGLFVELFGVIWLR